MIKGKRIFKKIALILCGIGVISGAAVGITQLVNHIKQDTTVIHPTFEVGGLDTNGKYLEDKTTLYTQDKFACEGLKVTLDFDATIDYQVFYYDMVDNYISSTDILSEGFSAELPLDCAYARMMIIPRNDEDGKISWTEKHKYSNQLEIKVSKNASKVEDKFVDINNRYYKIVNNIEESVFVNGVKFSEELEVSSQAQFCSTTKTICYTGNYKKLKLDFSKIDKGEDNVVFVVFEFNEKPTSDTKYTHTDYASWQITDNTITLKRDTRYILMSVYCVNENVINSNYYKFASCLTLTN
ncbi:MAG: hypothetical protein NC087_01640 [Anaeroplasma bactoclasticum]|nr:hypothetical protein [Anaeroplasma bactoclasticum]